MTAIIEQNPELVLDQSADEYWNHYQLTFALYSVSDRAIPSAYDGLKPGQRRLLYQMHDSKLLPGNKPQKSSKVCSAVTGNLHPHGGASMYGQAPWAGAGASGSVCSMAMLLGYVHKEMAQGRYRRVLALPTGCLHSPTTWQQGDSCPGISHAIVLEAG